MKRHNRKRTDLDRQILANERIQLWAGRVGGSLCLILLVVLLILTLLAGTFAGQEGFGGFIALFLLVGVLFFYGMQDEAKRAIEEYEDAE